MAKKIGVIAGSPVDTQMGVDVLASHGFEAFAYAAANEAREQTEFQMQPEEVRTEKVRSIMKTAISDGMDAIMIYCNSLSSTIDMESLGKELSINVVTPLMAYAKYADKYKVLALIAGNNHACAGIERTIMQANLKATVIGTGLLPMVVEVEAKTPPLEIYKKFGLDNLISFYKAVGAECFILGCTHFPYIREVLDEKVDIDILDPADDMCEMLR